MTATICRVPECTTPVATKKSGLCMRHYKQDRNGTLEAHQVPATGSVSGHGWYGILDSDGVRVMCHECGEWKKSLGKHLHAAHGMTAREYKISHGLPLSLALMGAQTKEIYAAVASSRVGTEAWKRLEAKRDPVAASAARDEETFHSIARQASRDPQRAMDALAAAPPKTLRWQECVACGKRFQSKVTTKTCGEKLCMNVSQYEAQPTFREMKSRARMHEIDGLNFSEIARDRRITPQAVRISYRGWQKYKRWKHELDK